MDEDAIDKMFPEDPIPSLQEKFEYHKFRLFLGDSGSDFHAEIICEGADAEDCACVPSFCNVRDLYSSIGLEAVRSEETIELVALSARIDWSDPEEPWIDVKP